MPRLANGATFAHFVVEAPIGQGGMGEVYRVRHLRLGRILALKILHTADEAARARLMKEARLQASLLHPNIVAVTDVLEVDQEIGVVMEYVEGPPLQTWIPTYRPSLEQRLEVFRGALSGVAAAHRAGLVHRDLKPANILISFWDRRPVPKVADFGIAKNLESMASHASLTRQGSSLGTPRYMAPEQIEDAKAVDHRADIFSMGCVLYEMLCERPAFPQDNPWAAMAAIRGGRFKSPGELTPELPAAVCRAIEGCLVPERERRIPDCAALLAVLDGAQLAEVLDAPDIAADRSMDGVVHTGGDTVDFAFDQPDPPDTPAPIPPEDVPPAPSSRPTLAPDTEPPASTLATPAPRHLQQILALALAASLAGGLWWLARPGSTADEPAPAAEVPAPTPAGASEPFPGLPEPQAEPAAPPSPVQPDPAPVVARPRPIAVAPITPDLPSPSARSTGTFRAPDDVAVFLECGSQRYREGAEIPPGSCTVHALFSGSDYVIAGSVDVAAGQEVVLRCHRAFQRCGAE